MAHILNAITNSYLQNVRLTEGTGALIGYARVSTDDQDCAAQVYDLHAAGCSEVVTEHASGADRRRPALTRLLGSIRPGETLVVVRLDRLARSVQHLLEIIEQLQAQKADLRSLRDSIDTTSPSGRFMLTVIGAVAELERNLIIERTRAGVAAAARAGRLPGSPGLRARDRAAIAALAAHRRVAARARATAALAPWSAEIEASRPATSWKTLAARIAAEGGPSWSGERLRCTWRRLQGQAG